MTIRTGLGPEPVPSGPVVVTSAQAQVLDALRDRLAPVTAAALGKDHGLHPNTVREHLEVLVERGLATRTRLPAQGRGRPAFGYLAGPALSQTQAHAALVDALADHLAQADDPGAAAERIGRRYAQELPEVTPTGDPEETDALQDLTRHMARLGFRSGPTEHPETVRLLTCPLLSAARRHQHVVCGFHVGLARGLLEARGTGRDADIEPFAEPGACLLTLTPEKDSPTL